ncbi:MAG: hypothetical protein ACK6D3_01620 [Planctomycetaceae bacterium]|jgi:hypothetical protein
MNEDLPHDPELRRLATQLAACPPQVAALEKDQIFYACAFAAGKNASDRTMRLWRTTAAVLSVLVVGAMLPYLLVPSQKADQPISQSTLSEPLAPPSLVPRASFSVAKNSPTASLDAWHVPTSNSELLSQQLTEMTQFSSHLRSLTVSALSRAILNP